MKAIEESTTLAIIGLGYIDLPVAVEFGSSPPSISFDIHTAQIKKLKGGNDHTLETTLEKLHAFKHLNYTTQLDDLRDSNALVVTVATTNKSLRMKASLMEQQVMITQTL